MKNLLFIFSILLVFTACTKSSTDSSNATLNVRLVDAPVAYDKVYIDIQDVQVKVTSDTNESGWTSLNVSRKGVYNILDFRNGLDTLLGSISLPAGTISQLRLVLGNNNSVVYNGVTTSMQTPSSQQSGLKLQINSTFLSGLTYTLWIDFDASKSIVHTGNNNFILKPVIRVFNQATSGAITGIVLPANSKSSIYAITALNDTVTSTQIDTVTGAFLLRGIPAGTYSVNVHVNAGLSKDSTKQNVIVNNGAITTLGTIQLQNQSF